MLWVHDTEMRYMCSCMCETLLTCGCIRIQGQAREGQEGKQGSPAGCSFAPASSSLTRLLLSYAPPASSLFIGLHAQLSHPGSLCLQGACMCEQQLQRWEDWARQCGPVRLVAKLTLSRAAQTSKRERPALLNLTPILFHSSSHFPPLCPPGPRVVVHLC